MNASFRGSRNPRSRTNICTGTPIAATLVQGQARPGSGFAAKDTARRCSQRRRHPSSASTSTRMSFAMPPRNTAPPTSVSSPDSITAVPIRDDHSFDVIVCFEAIEHIEDQEALLAEVKRLLKPDGLFIVSTPNKAIYHDRVPRRESVPCERTLLQRISGTARPVLSPHEFLGQRIHPGSSIWPIAATLWRLPRIRDGSQHLGIRIYCRGQARSVVFHRDRFECGGASSVSGSVLLDQSDSLLEEKNEQLRWREQQVVERGQTIQSLDEAVKWHEGQVRDLTETLAEMQKALDWKQSQVKDLEQTIDSRDNAIAFHENTIVSLGQTISSHEKALEWRAQQVSDLQTAKEYLERESASTTVQLQNAQRQLAAASDALAGIYASRGWKFLMKLRSIRDRLKALGKSRG